MWHRRACKNGHLGGRLKVCFYIKVCLSVSVSLTYSPEILPVATAQAADRRDFVSIATHSPSPIYRKPAPHQRSLRQQKLLRPAQAGGLVQPPRLSYRNAIELLLGLNRNGEASRLADEALERYPRESELHFQIATLFRHYRQCTAAKPFFQRMRRLYRSTQRWPALHHIETACGDLWVQSASVELRISRQKSLVDAPQQDYVTAESGSRIDQFCQLYTHLCGNLRQLHHNVYTAAGYRGKMTTTFAMTRPNDNGKFGHLALQLAKNVTSKSSIGGDGFTLRYLVGRHRDNQTSSGLAVWLGAGWEKRGRDGNPHQRSWAGLDLISARQSRNHALSYQQGLSFERRWADQVNSQIITIKGGIAGRLRNQMDWRIDVYFDRRNRLFHPRRQSASLGRAIKADLRWPLSPAWVMTLSYQPAQRRFLTSQLYLAAPHRTTTTRFNMRLETPVSRFDGLVIGMELDRLLIRSQDQFSRRRKINYAIYFRQKF